jgi:hypothetical protein
MKRIFLTIITLCMLSPIFAQGADETDTVIIFINAKKTGQYIIKPAEKENVLLIKKITGKTIKTMAIQIKGPLMITPAYTKILKLFSGTEPTIITEVKGRPGFFDITDAEMKKRIASGKKTPVYLNLDPSNPMILKPSKQVLIGNLVMQ